MDCLESIDPAEVQEELGFDDQSVPSQGWSMTQVTSPPKILLSKSGIAFLVRGFLIRSAETS
jgi:hypothetical protein